MKNQNLSATIVAQLKPSKQLRQHEGQFEGRSPQEQYRQLGLFDQQKTEFPPQPKRQKPQISSTPGTSPKELSRYRVTLAGKVLGDRLTADEALALSNQSTH
jgi:hypothetical protein